MQTIKLLEPQKGPKTVCEEDPELCQEKAGQGQNSKWNFYEMAL